jgi:PAS domain S-box-containing protein
MWLRVAQDGRVVFEGAQESGGPLDTYFAARHAARLYGADITLELVPTRSFVARRASRAPNVVLVGGALISVLIAFTVLLGLASMKARDRYRSEYARYRLVTNHMPAMIATLDSRRRLVFANAAYVQWNGVSSEEELLGRTVSRLAGPYYADVKPHLDPAYTGKKVQFNLAMTGHGGRERHVAVQLVPDTPVGGVAPNVYILMMDVTERERNARKIAETAERLQRFTELSLGREERMIALKAEVNALEEGRGNPAPYRIVRLGDVETGEAPDV